MIRRKLLSRMGDGAIRAFLLKAFSQDYFGELAELGEARCRAYWRANTAGILGEFGEQHPGRGCPVFPDGDWPLGAHLFGFDHMPSIDDRPDPRKGIAQAE